MTTFKERISKKREAFLSAWRSTSLANIFNIEHEMVLDYLINLQYDTPVPKQEAFLEAFLDAFTKYYQEKVTTGKEPDFAIHLEPVFIPHKDAILTLIEGHVAAHTELVNSAPAVFQNKFANKKEALSKQMKHRAAVANLLLTETRSILAKPSFRAIYVFCFIQMATKLCKETVDSLDHLS